MPLLSLQDDTIVSTGPWCRDNQCGKSEERRFRIREGGAKAANKIGFPRIFALPSVSHEADDAFSFCRLRTRGQGQPPCEGPLTLKAQDDLAELGNACQH
jgi:hypothetical protein